MCNTYLMQVGLPGVVLSDFTFLGICTLSYLLLTLVIGVMRVLHFDQISKADISLVWSMGGFQVVFILQNLSAAFYYHQVLYSTFRLANERYYKKCDPIDFRFH